MLCPYWCHLWCATGIGPWRWVSSFLAAHQHVLGSVLGPILFIIYTADLESIVSEHGLSLHQYADDSQIYGSCRPLAVSTLSSTVSQCVDSVSSWMCSNRLQLNADKTVPVVMWCTSTRKLSRLPMQSASCSRRSCSASRRRSRLGSLHRVGWLVGV